MEVEVDPEEIYFTHAKISRSFSGCGRRINETIQDITEGRTSLQQLPTITVLQCGDAFFTLNNRRLYVLKHLRTIGFLERHNNKVKVRLKTAKKRELNRYSVDRCSLTASFMGQQEEIGETQDKEWDGFLYREEENDDNKIKVDTSRSCQINGGTPDDTSLQSQRKNKIEVTFNDLTEKMKKEYSKILGLAQKGKVKDICKLLDDLMASSQLTKEHRNFIEKELEVL